MGGRFIENKRNLCYKNAYNSMKSRIFLFVLSLLFLWGAVVEAQSGGGEFAGGDGSAETPFLIENKFQLRNLNRYLGESRSGKHFKLVKDIVFEKADFEWGGDFYNSGKGWTPIGANNKEIFYAHVFDGNGFSIRGLYSSQDSYVGLFGFVGKTTIKNLYLLECRFVLGTRAYRPHAGILAGHLEIGRIEHCYCEGEISIKGGNDSYVGGVAGEISRGEVVNCYSKVKVGLDPLKEKQGGKYYVGGIAGVIINDGVVRNCYVDADMTVDMASMGGIVGCAWLYAGKGGLVENSYVRGSLSSNLTLGGVTSMCDRSSLKGNCVLLAKMEGSKLGKNSQGNPSINRVVPEVNADNSLLSNFVSERMEIRTDFNFQPVNDENGMGGALCPEKPNLAFWQQLGFAFGETPDVPWMISSEGYPVIYGFENLEAIYLRDVPDTAMGKRFRTLREYFTRNRDQCRKNCASEREVKLARLNVSYKQDLEGELKKYEEENWVLASGIQKELDALNASKVKNGGDSGLPEMVAKRKAAYLQACAGLEEDAGKWEDMLQLLKERYRDGLVAFQKDCLSAKDMKLASLAERELKKL